MTDCDIEKYYIRIIVYDSTTGMGMLRCDHKVVTHLLSMLKDLTIKGSKVETIRTSGTIKTLKQKLPYLKPISKKAKSIDI